MFAIMIIGMILVFGFMLYGIMVVASDADDREERMWNEENFIIDDPDNDDPV